MPQIVFFVSRQPTNFKHYGIYIVCVYVRYFEVYCSTSTEKHVSPIFFPQNVFPRFSRNEKTREKYRVKIEVALKEIWLVVRCSVVKLHFYHSPFFLNLAHCIVPNTKISSSFGVLYRTKCYNSFGMVERFDRAGYTQRYLF